MSAPAHRPGTGRTRILLGAAIALLLVLGIGAAVGFGRGGPESDPRGGGGAAAGPTTTRPASSPTTPAYAVPRAADGPSGGLVVNTVPAAAGTPTIDIYSDPQCPWCKKAHSILAPGFAQVLAGGKATVRLHLKTFLDDNAGNDSSKNVAGAAACASDAGRLWAYYSAALAAQPTQEGQGYTPEQIRAFATQAGIAGDALTTWQRCVAAQRYAGYVAAVEQATTRDGVLGTPTYRVDGSDIDLNEVFPPEGGTADPDAFFSAARIELER